jgi:hypothetical protein
LLFYKGLLLDSQCTLSLFVRIYNSKQKLADTTGKTFWNFCNKCFAIKKKLSSLKHDLDFLVHLFVSILRVRTLKSLNDCLTKVERRIMEGGTNSGYNTYMHRMSQWNSQYSWLKQTKKCLFFFLKNIEQEGKPVPVWESVPMGGGRI